MESYIYELQLYHHGIKGQKWGIRRFQKKDGTLTSAGKKRYSENVSNAKSAMKTAKAEKKAADRAFTKSYNKYSMIPTTSNYKKAIADQEKLKTAKSAYSKAKLGYKVAKAEEDGMFDSDKKKSNHRARLEEKYQSQGYSAKEASVLANGRIKTERILVGAAAVTVAACAAYAVNKHIKDKTDQILKSGTILQRVEMANTDGKLHETFYASTGDHDNKRYEGVLGFTRKMQTGKAYLMKLETKGDIKVASRDKAVKTFTDLYKNDSEFRDSVKGYVSKHPVQPGKNRVNINNLSDRNVRKMYDNFNSALVNLNGTGSGADKKFYSALKSAGYDAVQDVNDMKFSGYRAKNPLIVFNHSSDNIMVSSVRDLTKDNNLGRKAAVEIGKGQVESMGALLTSPYTAAALSGGAATMYVSDYRTNNKNNKRK